jgi:hypothetical protein
LVEDIHGLGAAIETAISSSPPSLTLTDPAVAIARLGKLIDDALRTPK